MEKHGNTDEGIRMDWQEFYRRVFDLNADDLEGIQIPRASRSFNRVVVVSQGLELGKLLEACRDWFRVSSAWDAFEWYNLVHTRHPKNGSYAMRIQDVYYSEQPGASNAVPITVFERLLLELKIGGDFHREMQVACGGSWHPQKKDCPPAIDWTSDAYGGGSVLNAYWSKPYRHEPLRKGGQASVTPAFFPACGLLR